MSVAAVGSTREAPGLSPAVAPPPGNPRFPELDAIRAIAVLAVLVFHVASVTGAVNRRILGDLVIIAGTRGVVVFFAVSGFLLYRPMVRARVLGRPGPGVARFARRRLLRILPAYWFALTVLGLFPGNPGTFSGDWWRYYGFAQIYATRTVGGGLAVAWSLCVEMSFYALLPLWALALRRTGRVESGRRWLVIELGALAAAGLGGIAVQALAARLLVSQTAAATLLGNCAWFALGMALAVISVEGERRGDPAWGLGRLAARPGLCLLGAAGCWVAESAVLHPGSLLGVVVALRTRQGWAPSLGSIALTAGICVFLMAPAVSPAGAGAPMRRLLGWRPLTALGVISYGVYLWHLDIAEVLGARTTPGLRHPSGLGLAHSLPALPTVILTVCTLALTAAVAGVSYRFVELPFLRRKER